MGVPGRIAVTRKLARLVYFFLFALGLLHGLVVTVRWWQDQPLAIWEYGFLFVFPVLFYLFITRYSIFRRSCNACEVNQPEGIGLDKHD
jgi:hypothetical protein